jgi:glucosamine--fructose-6-phosphate aminotransferase (isomerizing)
VAAGVQPTARENEVRAGLEAAIEELTRSIDTVKRQAKTATVGTSRSDSDLFDNVLVETIRSAGADVLSLSGPVLDVLRSLAAVVEQATGVTRYAVSWAEPAAPRVRVISKAGSTAHLPSRADRDAPLIGSKRRVVELATPGWSVAGPTVVSSSSCRSGWPGPCGRPRWCM